jgi:hypothetical protein
MLLKRIHSFEYNTIIVFWLNSCGETSNSQSVTKTFPKIVCF